ncbi:MAG: cupin domain-containing protein [Gammaproteobacteria bacterium]|nr:cupin domain-containing protein [Gammaproteobacteria bacterium]
MTRPVHPSLLLSNGGIPNNPRLPLLHYPDAVTIEGNDPAAAFEDLFNRHGWGGGWRNGILGFHHYHSTAHEVLGIYSGEVTVLFGGEGGLTVVAKPGDVILVPAGIGHKRIATRGRLGIVGAYPEGQHADLCQGATGNGERHLTAVKAVPIPPLDPVHGTDGPMHQYWQTA